MVVVVTIFISLLTPVPIAQDLVERISCTLFAVVFKASEVVKDSTINHFIYYVLKRIDKHYGAFSVDAYYF